MLLHKSIAVLKKGWLFKTVAIGLFMTMFFLIAQQLYAVTTISSNFITDGTFKASSTLEVTGSSTLYSTIQLGGYAENNLNYNIVANLSGASASRADVMTTDNDLFIEGNLETDGLSYFDAGLISSASSTFSGTLNVGGQLLASSTVSISGLVQNLVQTLTIADDGGGGGPTETLQPTSNYIEIDCQDSFGCTVTMSETGAKQGVKITMTNISLNTVTFSDTAGVSELAGGSFGAGQYDTLTLIYMSDRWLEVSRSNN